MCPSDVGVLCTDLPAKWNLPVPVVGYLALFVVLQVERVHVESIDQEPTVPDVESRAVKVDLQPFVWVHVERVCELLPSFSIRSERLVSATKKGR